MVQVTIPGWLARKNSLPTLIEGEVQGETDKAYRIIGHAMTRPSVFCLRCGRVLENPASRVTGFGPECCAKLGIERPDLLTAEQLDQQIRKSTHFDTWLPKSQVTLDGQIPPKVQPQKKSPTLSIAGNRIILRCEFEDKDVAKSVDGYRWDPNSKSWSYPASVLVLGLLKKRFGDRLQVGNVENVLTSNVETGTYPKMDLLYPFQKEGVDFMVKQGRVLNADDMGLGKTVEALMSCVASGAHRILVVCPNSLKWNWKRESERWTNYTVQIVHGDPDTRESQIFSQANITIINLEAIRLHVEDLAELHWDVVIIDEAHRVKNRHAKVTLAARRITARARNVYLLTGTPILNHPYDLWSLLNLIDPHTFSSFWKFVTKYCHLYDNGWGDEIGGVKEEELEHLKEVVKAVSIRRTKGQVLTDLPAKTVQKAYIQLEGKHAKIYQEMRDEMYTQLSSMQVVSASVVIAQIIRLKQIVIDPHLMGPKPLPLNGPKVDYLLDLLAGTGGKVVVFSQFAQALKRLAPVLKAAGYELAMVIGDIVGEKRDQEVARFQEDPTCRVLLASIQAGGQGLTLTAASTAVFLDKAWTPAMNVQAQDRLHRIGQTEPVTIVEILAEDTIEEKIEELLQQKEEWSAAFFEADNVPTNRVDKATLLGLLQG